MSPAAVVLLLALAAPTAPSARDAGPRGRFVIGVPERLAMAGDHQHPRRYERVESAVAAYADVDEVVDATWLRHEVEGYARHAVDCTTTRPPGPCLRVAGRLGPATVIRLISGSHAELLWTSGHRAVRLGWRRLVTTPTGTMTVDEPPADFAAALLAELPSDLAFVSFDDSRRPTWADDEIDRRLDYAERALDGCAAAGAAAATCLYFARASLLAVEDAEGQGGEVRPPAGGEATPISVRLRLAAARLRRAAARQSALAAPWCAVPPLVEPPQLARLP